MPFEKPAVTEEVQQFSAKYTIGKHPNRARLQVN